MSAFGKRNEMAAEFPRGDEASQASLEQAPHLPLSKPSARGDADWPRRVCSLLTLIGFLGLLWIVVFALYLYTQSSLDACKQYLKYAALVAPPLVFITVSNLLIKRETLNQLLIQICVVAACCGVNAIMMNWLLDDGEPRLVTMFIGTKNACDPAGDALCVYGKLQTADSLPFYTGNTICKVDREDYDRVLVGQTRMTVRVHPGRLDWEWQESGCTLQF
jgi:hypothetical protein